MGVRVVFKTLFDLRSLLRSDKTRIPPESYGGVVYQVVCGCGARYIGESGYSIEHRFRQHLAMIKRYRNAESRSRGENVIRRGRPQTKNPTLIMEECINGSAIVGHVAECPQPDEELQIFRITKENNFKLRKIKEAMFIRHNECMNRDEGAEVSDIWTTVGTRTKCCRCKISRTGRV